MPKQVVSLSFVMIVVAGTAAWAAEQRIAREELPIPVRKTMDEQSRGAAVRGYTKDKEGGQWEYEVEMSVNGHSKDVTVAPDGAILEIEEQVNLMDLAQGVQSGLAAKSAKGKIVKVESITKRGKIVAYEAQVTTGSRHTEIQVSRDGGTLVHEE